MATADINCTNLTGRLTRDIDVRATNSGTIVGNLSLAYSGVKKTAGGFEEVPNFVDCVLLGTRAEALRQYLTKGTKVAVSGELRYRQWERDGIKHSKHEILIDRIQFMSTQKHDEQAQSGVYADVYDENVPF